MKLQLGSPPEDGNYFDSFIMALEAAGAGEGTIKMYSSAIKNFLEFVNKDPKSVTSNDINKWILYLSSKKGRVKDVDSKRARSVTLREYVIAVRRFLKWLGVQINPVLPRARRKEIYALSESEIQAILSSATRLRDKLIIKLFLDTGLRSKELLSLRIKDIDLEKRIIRVRETKNGEERIVFFTKDTEVYLRRFILRKNKKDDDKLFDLSYQALYKIIKRIGNKAGIHGLRPHILRHTFATTAIRRGVPLPVVQRLLGHKDIKTTQIYTHLVLEDLEKVYKQSFELSSS
ncbi:tyrosine-type recombinase/integrase [Acidianus sulfidivorans JP7]|uniref:Tyrosine recombinase XerA n=1 Tax=Acidianus sulfidivorans JP7 TaxID=619593 RepID=A0A2U9INW9_9CREN|nr:site-specific tyrosine recombinase/integron integrase [Acidianus sulfidivorans]AWR97686.1 tyrosine-type recombinase/integrase [Acidianus sulfidivorans JP7]